MKQPNVLPDTEPADVGPLATRLMGRGLTSDLALHVARFFCDWESFIKADTEKLREEFSPDEVEKILLSKERREISPEIVRKLIRECDSRCCLCWNFDNDTGVIIHHIRAHAKSFDDSFENLIFLCSEHHSKVHTKWELARHPYPPDLLEQRKEEFRVVLSEFKAGQRQAPGREGHGASEFWAISPLPPPNFVGRTDVVKQVGDQLQVSNRRAAIVGMGGVGKTALMTKVVQSYASMYPGGILWAEEAIGTGGLQGVLQLWLKSLGRNIDGTPLDEQVALLAYSLTKRVLGEGAILLVIDSLSESFLHDARRLLSYVPPGVSLLIGTREMTVAVAIEAASFSIEALDRTDSRNLLAALSATNESVEEHSIDELLTILGDLPLAIELVAGHIRIRRNKPDFNLGSICRQLKQFNPGLLSFPGHRSIGASFALSYDSLEESEKKLFRSLGAFALGPLHLCDVSVVSSLIEPHADAVLERLTMVSILHWGNLADSYRMHPLLHQYAEHLLDLMGCRQVATGLLRCGDGHGASFRPAQGVAGVDQPGRRGVYPVAGVV